MQVGDKVNYVPHECHALTRQAHEDYPWVLGRRTRPQMVDPATKEVIPEVVKILTNAEADDFIRYIRGHPNTEMTREQHGLLLIRPARCFDAVVTEVHDDETVSVDVPNGQGGTLHYRVDVDPDRAAHTVHDKE